MVRYLLDTHTLLWFIAEDKHLSDRARRLILDSSSEILISIAESLGDCDQGQYRKLALDKPFR